MTTKLKIPKIRFKEFSGEWEEEKLNQFAMINPKNWDLPNKFIYIDLESVEKWILKKENTLFSKNAPSRAQRILNNNDILFQTVRPYQKNNFFFKKEWDYVASTWYAQIRKEKNNEYLFHFLHNEKFVSKVLLRCTWTSYPAINSSDLGDIKISFPKDSEQLKIASFLSSVDEKIKIIKEKKKNLEDYKKWVMQKIFSRKLRFKDENWEEYEKWEEKELEELIIKQQKTNRLSSEWKEIWLYTFFNNSTKASDKFINEFDYDWEMIIANTWWEAYFDYYIWKFWAMSDCFVFTTNENVKFLYFFLKTEQEKINQVWFTGSWIKHLNKDYFWKIKIKLPPLKEQEKIADFLSGIDEKIEKVGDVLEKIEEFKKGLLQSMFI